MKRNSIAKRAGALVLCAALTAGSLAVAAGAAQSSSVTAQLSPNISIVVDGTERTFYNVSGQEVHPITYNGTTYLPIRSIGELMGKNVNWDQSTLTVSLTSPRTADAASGTPDGSASARQIAAELHPEYTITVDGTARTFSDANGKAVYPLLYNGSIYLPIRAIGQLMGKTVSWNGTSSTVTLTGGSDVTDADSFNQSGTGSTTASITAERAREIALNHAGLTASQVTFARADLDRDDGRLVYDVEFYTSDYKEYDYEIDASTGAVLSYDYDAEHYNGGTGSTTASITAERAREIALNHAGLTASQVTFAVPIWIGTTAGWYTMWSSTPATTRSTTTRSTPPPARCSPMTTTPSTTAAPPTAAAPAPAPPSARPGPGRSPWPRCPAPPTATSGRWSWIGTTAGCSTR